MPLKCNFHNSSVAPLLKGMGALRLAASWWHLKVCAVFYLSGFALMQGTALADDNGAQGSGYRGVGASSQSRRAQNVLLAQSDEDGAMLPGGDAPQKRFTRRVWQGRQFPGGGDQGMSGQMRDMDTGAPGGFPPEGPGMGMRRRGPGRFGPGGRPGGFRRPPGGPPGGGKLNLTLLGLSEEQKEKIRQMRVQTSAKARGLRRELRMRRAEMKDLMFDPDATESQIRGKRKVIRQMQDQLEDVVIDDFLALRAVLTPEQRKRLPEVRPDARMPVMGPGPTSMGGPEGGFQSGRLPPGGPPQRFGGPAGEPSEGPLD